MKSILNLENEKSMNKTELTKEEFVKLLFGKTNKSEHGKMVFNKLDLSNSQFPTNMEILLSTFNACDISQTYFRMEKCYLDGCRIINSDINLKSSKVSMCNLSKSKAYIYKSTINDSTLLNTFIYNSMLSEFINCDMTESNGDLEGKFINCDLSRSRDYFGGNFTDCKIVNATISRSKNSFFSKCDLSGSVFSKRYTDCFSCVFDECIMKNTQFGMHNATFQNCDLSKSKIHGNLTRCKIINCELKYTEITTVFMSFTEWKNINFKYIIFNVEEKYGIKFNNSKFINCVFDGVEWSKIKTKYIDFSDSVFYDCDFKNSNFTGSILKSCKFNNCMTNENTILINSDLTSKNNTDQDKSNNTDQDKPNNTNSRQI